MEYSVSVVNPLARLVESMVIRYRFGDNMRTGISVDRYARMLSVYMERLWVAAIRRLMAAKGWKQQDLARESGVRPNTISDALGGTDPRIDTLSALAKALDVPLWALFCTGHEHAIFSERLKLSDSQQADAARIADVRAAVRAELAGLEDALVAKHTGQSVALPVKELAAHPKLAHSAVKQPKRKIRA